MKTLRLLLTGLMLALFVFAPAPALAVTAIPSGSFIVGEVDGDDFDFLLVTREGSGTLRARRANDSFRPANFTVASSEGALHTLRFEGETPAQPESHAWLFMRTADEGLFWTPKNDSLMIVRRTVSMPSSLLGEWRAGRESDSPPWRVSITSGSVHFTCEDKEEKYAAWALGARNGLLEVVLAESGDEGRIHYFQPLPDGSVLMWRAESSEYRVLYRGDKPPAWIAPTKEH